MVEKIAACEGSWQGTSELQLDPDAGTLISSGSTAVVSRVANGNFVRSYAAPPGPDWGWRTMITHDGDTLRIVMNNIWPEGREDLAVDANYTRV